MLKYFAVMTLVLTLVFGGVSFAKADDQTAGLDPSILDIIQQVANGVLRGTGNVTTTGVNSNRNTLNLGANGRGSATLTTGDGADKLIVDGDIISRENGTEGGGLVQGEKYLCLGKGNNNHCIGGEATDRQYAFMEQGSWCGMVAINTVGSLPIYLPNSFPCMGYTLPQCPPHFKFILNSALGGSGFGVCLYEGSGNW